MLLWLWSSLKIQCRVFFALITNSNNVRWLISLPEFYLCNEFSELCLEIDDNFMAVTHLFRLIIHTHHSQKLFNMLYHMRFNLVCNNFQSILRSLFKSRYSNLTLKTSLRLLNSNDFKQILRYLSILFLEHQWVNSFFRDTKS